MTQVWEAYLACEALGSVTRAPRVQDCTTERRVAMIRGEGQDQGLCSALTTLLQIFKVALLLHHLSLCVLKLRECGLQLRFHHGTYVGMGPQPASPPLASPNPPASFPSPSAFKLPPNPCFLQQFLQAPTSSFRELNITFCFEARMTPPHTHKLGQRTPFSFLKDNSRSRPVLITFCSL